MVGAYSYGVLANLFGDSSLVGRRLTVLGTLVGASAGCTLGIIYLAYLFVILMVMLSSLLRPGS